jgi:hypothetical protein
MHAHAHMRVYACFSLLFQDSLTMNYTTLNLVTYLEVVLGRTKYNHQDGDIPNKGISLVLFYHGSMVDERDPSIFILFQDSLTMNYTTSRLGLPIRGIRNYKISSPGQ